ncbi:loricrin, putative [Trichomonas vaginalis G3]|uniref:receptor protein-tyrosine kinase n=1 Tax=Trichomonas vaginalis (strain ATCC PRA-98 / G3) TaxID=412133 RepID=A2EUX4_TRIV3|nr:glycine-rich protein family [Trichomonas vaginalis G3]EAY03583.1 loricrin, putative [Trichomonas vaginalis G3]KAI5550089.1 glycine-rich protein family [Trichomonas vaginalis G3]|eukprot:XP_001315806.1 loricrin [Trichomonas vaginalis G3]
MQWNFSFKGSKNELTLQPGRYLLECWGAQGGGKDVSALAGLGAGGKGGYSSGTIFLQKSTPIFVYVGGTGKVIADGIAEGGFNGGGSAWGKASSVDPAGGGGGATDIRLNIDDLYSRVIVAGGGGGGGEDSEIGGFGGGLEGGRNSNNWVSYPGAQNSSSHGAAFGHGAHTPCNGGGAVVVGMEAVLIMAKKLLLALLMAMIQMEVQVEAVMFTPEKHRNIIQQDAN